MIVAKSDCGLPANSHATPQNIGREEEDIRWDLAFGKITQQEFDERYEELEKQGKVWRRR